MSRRINIVNRGRRLETIFKDDRLIFHDREETVVKVDNHTDTLYTERVVENRDVDSPISSKDFPIKREQVAYECSDGKIRGWRYGHVYNWTKERRTA